MLFSLFSHNVGIILENRMFLLIKYLESEVHKISIICGEWWLVHMSVLRSFRCRYLEVWLGMFACLLVLGEEKPYCSNKNVLKQGRDSVIFFLEVMFVV